MSRDSSTGRISPKNPNFFTAINRADHIQPDLHRALLKPRIDYIPQKFLQTKFTAWQDRTRSLQV
jgi:hypothetical protein